MAELICELLTPDTIVVLNKKRLLTGLIEVTEAELKTLRAIGYEIIELDEEEEVVEVELPGYQEQLAALSELGKVPAERNKGAVEAAYIEHVVDGEHVADGEVE